MAIEHNVSARRRWISAMTMAVFIGAFFVVRWVVTTQRAPGSISVIEAQGMDMGAMKAPVGTQPVTAVLVHRSQIGAPASFPATIMALSDEEVVARVPGRVVSIAYPGDTIESGQVVVKLDAQEFQAQASQARLAAKSVGDRLLATEQEVERQKTMRAQSVAGVDAANAAVSKAQSDVVAFQSEAKQLDAEAGAMAAKITDAQAGATFAEQVQKRKETLYKEGAISLNDYQSAVADHNSALARLESARAEHDAALQSSLAASARSAASRNELAETRAQARLAAAAIRTADQDIAVAKAQTEAARSEAQSADSQADSSQAIAGYTELKSLDAAMVAERYVSPGSIVTAGEKLLMLHVASSVRIQAQLPETLSQVVDVGAPVEVEYGSTNFSARVTSIFPTVDTSTRTFTVEALVPNTKHKLLPGSFATMSVRVGERSESLSVPNSAIQTDASGDSYVWIVTGVSSAKTDWTCPMHTQVSLPGPGKCPICKMELVPRTRSGNQVASRRKVETGQSDGAQTGVTTGLNGGDEVITAGFEQLIEGSPVKATLSSTEASEKRSPPALRILYTCPMHPEVEQDHPGKCPKCGMELVPKKASR